MKIHETSGRSLAKAITFRLLIITADTFIIYAITKRSDITLGVVVISNISSTILYFLHERAWNGVHWGRRKGNHHWFW